MGKHWDEAGEEAARPGQASASWTIEKVGIPKSARIWTIEKLGIPISVFVLDFPFFYRCGAAFLLRETLHFLTVVCVINV